MPGWVKHSFWFFATLIALAEWRAIGSFFQKLTRGLGNRLADLLSFQDPQARFMALGMLLVVLTGLVALTCNRRPKKSSDSGKDSQHGPHP